MSVSLPLIDCTPQGFTVGLVKHGGVDLPATGKFVGESHYLTTQDHFPGGSKYPTDDKEGMTAHLERSLALYQQYDATATLDGLFPPTPWHRVWTPSENGHIGQGSVGDIQLSELTPEMEMWFLTMMWKPGARPARGTKFLLRNGGKQVVVVAGFETGPGSAKFLGGVTWEVHKWLGSDNDTQLTLTLLADQSVPIGPVDCA